tara:strand:+ start:225 stop:875 length:651 start_codon:yes stop_codon:yes gene_type:complete
MEDFINGSIVFTSRSRLEDPIEPTHFVTEFSGLIKAYDDDIQDEVEIGRIEGSVVQMKKNIDYGYKASLIFDASTEINEYMTEVWDYDSNDYSKLINPDGEYLCDTLILSILYIYPEFNGHGYGLAAIQRTIEHFDRDHYLVLFKADPLQFIGKERHSDNFNKRMDISKFETDEDKAHKSLMNYYSLGGFKRLRNTNYMYKLKVGYKENLVNGAIQ